MLLSLRKKQGHTHVKAARILRVVQEHAVPTTGVGHGGTSEQLGGSHTSESVDRFRDQNWVFCKEGDLVIEVVKAKRKLGKKCKVIGYSYLTGPAIQLMYYEAKPEFFSEESLKVGRIKIPDLPKTAMDVGYFLDVIKGVIEEVKVENDICLLQINTNGESDANKALNIIGNFWEEAPGEAHLIGEVTYGEDKGVHVHFQTEEHASELYANFFQTQLLFGMVKP